MKRVIIIGGSLGGLFVANLLNQAGWDVQVFERVGDELSERGAGIVTHAELFDVLKKVGISIDDDIGIEILGRRTLDQFGHILCERNYPQILTAWGRLFSLLKNKLPPDQYASGKTLGSIRQLGDKVIAEFTDGTSAEGDLLIGADGIRSTARAQYLPSAMPQYAGYVAWRGLVEEGELSAATHDSIFEHFSFCLPPREQILGYPVAGAYNALEVGKRRYNFVWYRPADNEELRRLSTDSSGKVHDNGIPPPLISSAVLKEIRATANAVLAPQFAELVSRTALPFFQPIYDLQTPNLVFGRVVLLGDAAYVARPHCGMGVTKAAGDAVTLATLLASLEIDAALAQYNQLRTSYGASIVKHAQHLGAYMQAQIETGEEQEMAEKYRTPEAVMRETAVPPQFN